MKLLVIHNKYQVLGGEDIAVENEIKFLEKHFEIRTIQFSNQEKNIVSLISSLIFNRNFKIMKKIKEEIFFNKPDYVYIHNTWFMVPLSLFKFLRSKNIVTIIKLHNFRYDCTRSYSAKKHIFNKEFCNACGMKMKKYKYFNKYFNNSYLKSFLIIKFGKKLYKIFSYKNIKLFVLTSFHKQHLIQLGFDKNKIYIHENFIEIKERSINEENGSYIVYAGRISAEKGVEEVIKSFNFSKLKEFKLKIIGTGPELKKLMNKYSSDIIEFYGFLPNSETLDLIYNSAAVVTATKLLEGQPTLLCEASLMGVPSIFPNTGGISDFFPKNYELSFEQFNYNDLIHKLNLINNTEYLLNIGKKNKEFINQYLNENRLIQNFKNSVNE